MECSSCLALVSGRLVRVKRIFVIFLLVIVPFQLAWAGVGVYCQHEEGLAAQHFGHHDHKHTAQYDQGKGDAGKLNPGADNDCSSHLNSGQCFLSRQVTPSLPQGVASFDLRPPIYVSYIPDGPVRPDRSLAA